MPISFPNTSHLLRCFVTRPDKSAQRPRLVLINAKVRRFLNSCLRLDTRRMPLELLNVHVDVKVTPMPWNGLAPTLTTARAMQDSHQLAKRIVTYNRRDSQMVTHSNTSRPIQCLCKPERTGWPALIDLWSYVPGNIDMWFIKFITEDTRNRLVEFPRFGNGPKAGGGRLVCLNDISIGRTELPEVLGGTTKQTSACSFNSVGPSSTMQVDRLSLSWT